MTRLILITLFVSLIISCKQDETSQKPTLYIIGDSTVKNGRGDGAGGLWGWGDPIVQYFDTSKINVENHALGGTSSRTYRTKGLWEKVRQKIKPGDFVLMQFGHNDSGALNDTLRARGTIQGIGDESEEIDNMLTGGHEIVHTYGWYMRQYIQDVKDKGAIPVIIAPIPRNDWEEGKVLRNDESYGKWAQEVAEMEQINFINLNEKMASAMENLGEENVTGTYFFKRDRVRVVIVIRGSSHVPVFVNRHVHLMISGA